MGGVAVLVILYRLQLLPCHLFSLPEIGVENYVVRPRNWDEYGSSVKTDARDARDLCGHLDRYLAGNARALCVVRVPTQEQEGSIRGHRLQLSNLKIVFTTQLSSWRIHLDSREGHELAPPFSAL